MAVPPVDQPGQASWYAGEHPDVDGDEWQPGENGPAVIAGHVDGIVNGQKGSPGVFFRLHELTPGAEIIVDRDGADPLTFVVDRVEQHHKDALDPASKQYDPALVDAIYLGPTERPELRIVTCGGTFDRASGHYLDNVIVWAHLA
jgi:sortase (surface protein transpeptidase)